MTFRSATIPAMNSFRVWKLLALKTMRFFAFLFISISLTCCRKDSFLVSPAASLEISTDSLKFDTVFTGTGSVTRFFKIINDNRQKILLQSVSLAGGNQSPFKLNIDGQSGSGQQNIELDGNDSIYVFVQVNADPRNTALPFVLSDSVLISYNGNERYVQLEAWGQQANFIRNGEVSGDQTWTNGLPYVILGYLHINEGATLRLQPGCRLYFHGAAPFVVDGTLDAVGTAASPVLFTGDRLDRPYVSYPASWPGIYFREPSTDNRLTHARILNAYQAVNLMGPASNLNPKLLIDHSVIDNAFDAGLQSVNSSARVSNTLISNCGKNVLITLGGDYQFDHCTIASYFNNLIAHQYPVLQVSNTDGNGIAPLNAAFRNCICWGDGGVIENEVTVTRSGTAAFSVLFDHVLWKIRDAPADVTLGALIENQDPLFAETNGDQLIYDFHLRNGSPAINAGVAGMSTSDLDGSPRPVGLPDLGCYEKQP